jgi:hypothetical protein
MSKDNRVRDIIWELLSKWCVAMLARHSQQSVMILGNVHVD